MPVVKCPHCGESCFLPTSAAGTRISCPHCRNMLANPGKSSSRREKEVVFEPADADDEPPQPTTHGPRLRTPGGARRTPPHKRRSGSGSALGLGTASLVVGASQFLFCALTPFAGLLVFPAAVVGLLLGAIGLAISLSRKSGDSAFPIAGLAVNAIALGVVSFWTFALGSAISEWSSRQRSAEVVHRAAPADGSEQESKAVPQPEPAPVPPESPSEPERPAASAPADTLRAGLKSTDVSERRAAATRLRDLGAAATGALPELVSAVKDSDAAVREAAIDALGKLGRRGSAAYADVVRATDDQSSAVRQAAERFLQNFGQPPGAATTELLATAQDDKLPVDLQLRAMNLLAESAADSPAFYALCLNRLGSKAAPIRARAAQALGQPGRAHDRAVLQGLLRALGDSAKSVREAAAAAIERAGPLDASDMPALIEAVKGDSGNVKIFALGQLTQIGRSAREGLTEVSAALRDTDPAVRLAAMDCLLVIAPDRSGDVTSLLTDRDKEIRGGAIAALRRRLRPAACFEIFADALAAADETGRKEIAIALDRDELRLVKDVPARTKIRLSGVLTDANPVVRLKAAKALQRMGWGSERLARVLADLLREDAEGTSREAAETLGQMGESATRSAASDLVRALGSRDAMTRRAVAAALRSAAPLKPEAISPLIAALRDGALHDNISVLLAEFGESTVGDLTRALASQDVETRRGAAKTLGLIGPAAADAYRPLTQLFRNDPDGTVRNEASRAMELIRRRP
jgi:HEAT repeat protein